MVFEESERTTERAVPVLLCLSATNSLARCLSLLTDECFAIAGVLQGSQQWRGSQPVIDSIGQPARVRSRILCCFLSPVYCKDDSSNCSSWRLHHWSLCRVRRQAWKNVRRARKAVEDHNLKVHGQSS